MNKKIMKKILFSLVLMLFQLNGISQNVIDEITKELKLNKIEFGSKPLSKHSLNKSVLEDGTFNSESEIKHNIFKNVIYYYNQNLELNNVRYSFKNRKAINKYITKIYDVLDSKFGSPINISNSEYSTLYSFENTDFYIELSEYKGSLYDISGLRIDKINVLVEKKFDEFNKIKSFKPINFNSIVDTENNEQLFINFYCLQDKGVKRFYMKIKSEDNEWKFIEKVLFLFNNGEVFEYKFDTKKEIDANGFVSTKEIGYIELKSEILNRINDKDDVRLRVVGKSRYDFKFTNSIFAAFKIIKETYNN